MADARAQLGRDAEGAAGAQPSTREADNTEALPSKRITHLGDRCQDYRFAGVRSGSISISVPETPETPETLRDSRTCGFIITTESIGLVE